MQAATFTDPPPPNSPIINSKLVCKDINSRKQCKNATTYYNQKNKTITFNGKLISAMAHTYTQTQRRLMDN